MLLEEKYKEVNSICEDVQGCIPKLDHSALLLRSVGAYREAGSLSTIIRQLDHWIEKNQKQV